jgi:hypothetical protein
VETPTSRFNAAEIAFLKGASSQFVSLSPAKNNKTIVFRDSSDGLPAGSWRNSMAVADMNEDGFADIIVPPQRKGSGIPQIFLGDGKGHWRNWEGLGWPHTIDYGSVAVADFNKDGHLDLVFGVHLNGIFVFLGDGKGHFTESVAGLPRDFPTRRVRTADVDGDGYQDIIASSEGPQSLDRMESVDFGKIRAYLNRKKGASWEPRSISNPSVRVGGDWLSVGNFNGDRTPDFVASSVYQGSMEIIHLSDGKAHWAPFQSDGDILPSLSYYTGSATGKFSSKNVDDAIISFIRFWPPDLDDKIVRTPAVTQLVSIDRISFSKGVAKRTPIVQWSGKAGVWALASADFDRDGNLDLVYSQESPRQLVVLLGDGRGGFTEATVEGLKLEPNNSYDIHVADVNGDGRPDILLMYEMASTSSLGARDGSIRVFLNLGAKTGATVKSTTAR